MQMETHAMRLHRNNDNVNCNHLECIVLWGWSAHQPLFFMLWPVISDNNRNFARY